jgi:hypothetical protein
MKYDIKVEVTFDGLRVEEEKLDEVPYKVGSNPKVDEARKKYLLQCQTMIPLRGEDWNSTCITRIHIS